MAAEKVSFLTFVATKGKVKLRSYNMRGESWTALLCQDSEGNETFIAPSKSTNAVVDGNGVVLVDFNKPMQEIASAIKAHKEDLVVLKGNKNWEDPDAEVIPVYTLAAKLQGGDEIDIEL